MIRRIGPTELSLAADVIRASFATVAKDLGLTPQNCPKYTGFITTAERLHAHRGLGWLMYGLYAGEGLVGYVSLSEEADGAYELHNLAVLPDYRHRGYGGQLLDYCIEKVKTLGGRKITLGIVEENAVLKSWYAAHGFTHTGTKKFEHLPFTCGYMERELLSACSSEHSLPRRSL